METRNKVVAYITRRDRLLVFRHTQYPEAGIQVPAGTLRAGEPPAAGALREAWEETGLRDLVVRAELGVREVDISPYGKFEIHRRHYFHLELTSEAPAKWVHYESDPSDGGTEPIEFEFSWVRLLDELPPLSGALDQLLPELRERLACDIADDSAGRGNERA